jgi:hypothetical protein
MVVEVVVNDPNLKDTDEAESEPDVTVNGKDLRMAQATDGNWYAYIADLQNAQAADNLPQAVGTSLDYGFGCTAASATTITGVTFSDTEGVFFPRTITGGGTGTLGACTAITGAVLANNVVRENKTLTDFQ